MNSGLIQRSLAGSKGAIASIGFVMAISALVGIVSAGAPAVASPSMTPEAAFATLGVVLGAIGLWVVSWIVAAVFFIVWQNRSAAALSELRVNDYPHHGTAIHWFVPIMNLFKPYQAINDLERASRPDSAHEHWGGLKSDPVVLVWWLAFLFAGMAGPFGYLVSGALAIVVITKIRKNMIAKMIALDEMPMAEGAYFRESGLVPNVGGVPAMPVNNLNPEAALAAFDSGVPADSISPATEPEATPVKRGRGAKQPAAAKATKQTRNEPAAVGAPGLAPAVPVGTRVIKKHLW